jgi:hypothetical protein
VLANQYFLLAPASLKEYRRKVSPVDKAYENMAGMDVTV